MPGQDETGFLWFFLLINQTESNRTETSRFKLVSVQFWFGFDFDFLKKINWFGFLSENQTEPKMLTHKKIQTPPPPKKKN